MRKQKKQEKQQFTRPTPPYDTGKVLIGLTHTKPMPTPSKDEEVIQSLLLGEDPFHHGKELVRLFVYVAMLVIAIILVRP